MKEEKEIKEEIKDNNNNNNNNYNKTDSIIENNNIKEDVIPLQNKQNEFKTKKIIYIIITVILTLAFLGIGIGVGTLIGSRNNLSFEEQKLIDGYRILKDEWLYANDYDLENNSASSLLDSPNGDPYTFYTKTYEEQGLNLDGVGFGISTRYFGGSIYVREVHDGPSKNKLQVNDIIIGCKRGDRDYDSFAKLSDTDIRNYLGDMYYLNTEYLFKVIRNNKEIDVGVTKGTYEVNQLSIIEEPTSQNNYTLSVKIETFLGNPTLLLETMISKYLESTQINKLVIDLRENGGGYVAQAEQMAKLFVEKGTFIYSLVDKNNKTLTQSYQTSNPKFKIPNYSLIIDNNTASASEMFTLAMRAGTNAKIYGFKSYGKGIAQKFYTFDDGSTLRYTYAYVYGPRRKEEVIDNKNTICIQGVGINPDYTYSTDYTFMAPFKNLENLLSVNETNMQYIIKTLHLKDPKTYPASYSKNYHYTDILNQYATDNNVEAFLGDGRITKDISDVLAKDSLLLYLDYYQLLTNEVKNAG